MALTEADAAELLAEQDADERRWMSVDAAMQWLDLDRHSTAATLRRHDIAYEMRVDRDALLERYPQPRTRGDGRFINERE